MSNAEWWPICIAMAVVIGFLESIRSRIKRIEGKIDKLGK